MPMRSRHCLDWTRRHRRAVLAVALLAALVGVRAGLPALVRSQLVAQAEGLVRARVEVADVDLALLRGGIALSDVAVRPLDALGRPAEVPVVAFRRLSVELRWLPLLQRAVRFREIRIEAPRLSLDRREDGSLSWLALLPPAAPAPAAEDAPGPSTGPDDGWRFGVDRLTLRDGGLRFRDFAVAGFDPVELNVDAVDVKDVSLRPGLYGEPAHVLIAAAVEEGSLWLDAAVSRREAGFSVLTRIDVQRLPLHRMRLYLPQLGWSGLRGELEAALQHRFEPGGENAISGTAGVRDVVVERAGLGEPALSLSAFWVFLDTVDLAARHVEIGDGELDGLSLLVEPGQPDPLPVLASLTGAGPPQAAEAEADSTDRSGGQTVAPWRWTVGRFRLGNSQLRLVGPDSRLDLGVSASVEGLSGDENAVGRVDGSLSTEAGALRAGGALRTAPPGFAGTVDADDFPLSDVLAVAHPAVAAALSAPRLQSQLEIGAGMPLPGAGATEGAAGDLRVRGRVGLPDLEVSSGGTVVASAKSLDLSIDALDLPGALSAFRAPPGTADRAARVAGRLSVAEPKLALPGTASVSAGADLVELNVDAGLTPATALLSPLGPHRGTAQVQLSLAGAQAASGGESPLAARAESLTVRLTDLEETVAPESGRDVRARAALTATGLEARQGEAQGLSAAVGSLDLDLAEMHLTDVTPPGGVLQARGVLTVADARAAGEFSPGFSAAVTSLRLELEELVAALGGGAVAAGRPGPRPPDGIAPGDARLRGLLAAAGVELRAADEQGASVTVRKVEVPVRELALPGVLAAAPPGDAPVRPLRAKIGDAVVAQPALRATRTGGGLVLPGFRPPSAGAPAPDGGAPPVPAEVRVAGFRLSGGRIDFKDETVHPAYSGGARSIAVDLRNLAWPAVAGDPLRLSAEFSHGGTLEILGGVNPEKGWFKIDGAQIPLPPFNPYVAGLAGYEILRGSGAFYANGSLDGTRYYTENWIGLRDFDLRARAGDDAFRKQFGVPLSVALALMRDVGGDIGLDFPVYLDRGGVRVGIASVVGNGLRRSIVNALASPLKLVGSVFGGASGESVVPATVAFRTGRAEPAPGADDRVGQIATLLGERPGLVVTLSAAATDDDVRWLREQDLRARWENEGFLQAVLGLGRRGARERVRRALDERAAGEAGALSVEDAVALDRWLAEIPVADADRIVALAEGRVAAVESALRDRYAVAAARIRRTGSTAEPGDGDPVVHVEFAAGEP